MPEFEPAGFVDRSACLGCGGADLITVASGRYDEGPLAEFIAADPWGEDPAPHLRGQSWRLVRCEPCGLSFHRYVLDPAWNERRFSRWMSGSAIAEFEARLGSGIQAERAAHFTEHALRICSASGGAARDPSLPAVRVLDYGCGNGEFLAICGAFGLDPVGVDRSAARREHASGLPVYADLASARAHGPFDVITLFEVLEHLDDPRALLLELRAELANNALLVVETPDCTGVDGIHTRLDYLKIHPLDHINAFEPASLRKLVESTGFVAEPRPFALATSDLRVVARRLAKSILRRGTQATTQMYFRKR
jgi:2-polyprenyl-3-methyl-5-hydroxy-6-metoxy-1,4-benzoquinol methylase